MLEESNKDIVDLHSNHVVRHVKAENDGFEKSRRTLLPDSVDRWDFEAVLYHAEGFKFLS